MNIYERKKNRAKALESAEKAAAAAKTSDEMRLCAHAMFRLGDTKRGMQLVHRAIEMNPKSSSAYTDLSHFSRELGDYSTALSAANKAVAIDENTEALYHRAHAHMAMKNFHLAKQDIEHIISQIGRKDQHLFLTLAIIDVNLKDDKSCEAHLKESIRLDPNMAEPHRMLADLYERNGRRSDAIHEFNECIRLDPDNPDNNARVIVRRADNYINNGQDVEALLDLTSAIKLHPASSYYFMRAENLARNGQCKAALRDCARALTNDTAQDLRVLKLRSDCYRRELQPEKAIQDLSTCINFKPDTDLYQKRFKVLLSMKKTDEALRDINEAIKIALEPDGELYYLRGGAWNQLGEHQKALKDFQLALKLDPNDERFQIALDNTFAKLSASRKKQQ